MSLDPLRPRTRAEMRELDRRAIEEYAIPSLLLMENAGRAAADVAAEMVPPRRGAIVVFCGKGNNGGDGFVLARHLANRGYDVHVQLACPRAELPRGSDPSVNLAILERMGVPVLERSSLDARAAALSLVVDALLGTGLTGEVREPYSTLISLLNAQRAPILAIDIPSGLDCDTGEILGKAVRAHRTVTFAAPKLGFGRGQGPETTGTVTVADISIPRRLLEELPAIVPGAGAP